MVERQSQTTPAQTFGSGFYTSAQMAPWPKEGRSSDFEVHPGPEFRQALEVEWIRGHRERRAAKGYRRHVRRMKEAKR